MLKPADMPHQLYPRKDGYADRDLYPYNPSETAAYAFVAMFAIAGFTHLSLMFPYRAWFPIPMVIGTASMYTHNSISLMALTPYDSGSRFLLSSPPIA